MNNLISLKNIFVVLVLSTSHAFADTYLRCHYDNGNDIHQEFNLSKSDADTWMKNVAATKSHTGKVECVPIDNSPVWHLLSQSYGGVISLIKGLTGDECEAIRAKLMPDHCGASSCSYMMMIAPDMIKTAECFK